MKKEKIHHEFHDPRPKRHDVKRRGRILETKLFTDKEELVEYVNKQGQSSHHIDVFKIEDGLYKLVIKE